MFDMNAAEAAHHEHYDYSEGVDTKLLKSLSENWSRGT